MNYTKIRIAAALLLVSTSHLSATTTTKNNPVAITQEVFNLFNEISTGSNKGTECVSEIIKKITENEAVINAKNPTGLNKTILIKALNLELDKIINFLLSNRNINVNATDIYKNTALMWIASKPNPKYIKLLLNHGADVTMKNNAGQTALDIAIEIFKQYPDNEDTGNEEFEASTDLKKAATKETIKLLKTARMYLYAKRALWFLVAVLLVTLTGLGVHHYILKPKANA